MMNHRTKIVATIGPASQSPEVLREMALAGMTVARLNFSHGSYEDHAQTVRLLRSLSQDLDTPITLLQDLQGPKIRVGILEQPIELIEGETLTLVPVPDFQQQPHTIPIDYPHLAEEAQIGAQVLLDDGLLELKIEAVSEVAVTCQIIEGGWLKSRKGINLPSLALRLPSLTDKDRQDLEFGVAQGVDWVSLSFVRRPEDIQHLKQVLKELGAESKPVIAKIEKPQAIDHLEAIVNACDGVMVARGDLGVEMRPEKVPRLQKRIIRLCNQRGIPVITATQMLESMMQNPRPTRAEVSDVANAIIDGTDAVMLSGESAVGKFPAKSVEMLARVAADVEVDAQFINYPPTGTDETHALSEALNILDKTLDLRCIVAVTTTGYTAMLAAAERSKAPVIALTPQLETYHRLNLVWGVQPLYWEHPMEPVEALIDQVQACLLERQLAAAGDTVLILGGIPSRARGTNFLKIHRMGGYENRSL
ncbi:MAG: pyruvate kinase [Cyanobacteria bacterium P01_A01_bin.17]